MDWTIFTAIFTAITAIATFFAAGVALWIACSEQYRQDKHRQKVIKAQKCDLILIPTKEWDSGAHYQNLIGELTGYNKICAAEKYASENHDIEDYFNENTEGKMAVETAQSMAEHSIDKKWFSGPMIFISFSDLFWIDAERIYGVNIKANIPVAKAREYLIGTQYFKDAFVTTQGKKHDKSIKRKSI